MTQAAKPPHCKSGGSQPQPLWRELLRNALHAALLCLAVGFLLAAPRQWRNLGLELSYSFAIGMQCWIFIDGGRALVAKLLQRRRPDDPRYAGGWPGTPWMAVCVLLGSILGFSLGLPLGDLLTGRRSVYWWEASWGAAAGTALLTLVVASLTTGYFYIRGRMHAAQAEAEQAARVAAQTQLRLLEAQLEPHMLFNTLANLRVLIGIDPARAQTMLDQLIGFLRATLNASRQGSHSLQDEFARISDYLQLMQVRMGQRLQTELDLAPALQALQVPPLLLQPLVENAIKHGLEPKIEGGRLTLRASIEGEQLLLQVIDTGIGLAAAAGGAGTQGTRFGLTQVRDRLQTRYGSSARLDLAPGPDGRGCLATVHIPLSETQAPPTP